MKRYAGERLPADARIAVVANDALGNFVVATPLLQMLRTAHPGAALHYYGGTRSAELQEASDLFDRTHPLLGTPFRESVKGAWEATDGEGYDLLVNLENAAYAKSFAALVTNGYACGPCLSPEARGDLPYEEGARGALWADMEWTAEDLPQRYPFLQTGFIGELFCRLAYLDGPVPTYRVPMADPGGAVPDVLIATAASLPDKLWPAEKWAQTLRGLRKREITVGLLGAKPAAQRKYWKGDTGEEALIEEGLVTDLRGELRLPEVVGALARARAVLTLDNGILHLAAAAGAPTVGLFRHGIHRLWAPPAAGIMVLTPGPGRDVAEIPVETVQEALARAL